MCASQFRSKSVTIHDIANRAGVSIGTVSRALCNRNGVSSQTKQKVLDIAAELRFRPKTMTTSYNVALILPPLEELRAGGWWYSVAIYEAISRAVSQKTWATQIYDPGNTRNLADYIVDGIITMAGIPELIGASERLARVPTVVVNGKEEEPFHTVQTNHKQGGYLAGKLLIEAGHTKIAMLSAPFSWSAKEREDGIKQAMTEGGLDSADLMIFRTAPGDYDNGLARVLAAKATAIFVADEAATLAIQSRITSKYGLRVPDDISIVGFHVPGISDLHYPAITAIEQPFDELADKSVCLLEKVMQSKKNCKRQLISLDNKLWLGQSLGPPAK
ncbi:MAG: LacI family DNA-binding transcriptional regulator [Planctomycetota bacterium]